MSLKSILPNLGFIFQMSAMFILLPIIAAFYNGESRALISLFLTATLFFAIGFVFNAYSERRSLDLKSSAILLSVVFFFVSAIGAIPYIYNQVFPNETLPNLLTNSYFESVSGFTTTGFTLIKDIDSLPKSIVFYRAITEWIGGISIVFLILAFFYPAGAVTHFLKLLGIDTIKERLKHVLSNIIFVYVFYGTVLSLLLYMLVSRDLLNSISLILTSISTGGFSPTSSLIPFLSKGGIWILSVAMILGATNFLIHQNILKRKFRSIFIAEFVGFLLIIGLATWVFYSVFKIDLSTSFFHVVSAASTTGHGFIDLSEFSDSAKLMFATLMFVGGMSLSTAGGIKVWRLLFVIRSIPWVIRQFERNKQEPMYMEGKELKAGDVLVTLFIPILFFICIFGSIFAFTWQGFSLMDSVFETTSAISGTGLSVGVTSLELSAGLKWILTFLMILGRIEIIPLLVMLIPARIARKVS